MKASDDKRRGLPRPDTKTVRGHPVAASDVKVAGKA
jgi:hypothetical protein